MARSTLTYIEIIRRTIVYAYRRAQLELACWHHSCHANHIS